MIAVISDIHGNLEALQTVLASIREAEVDAIYCAGDIVGYGPNPNECCELVQKSGIKSVQGNHDFVCANLDRLGSDAPDFSEEDHALCSQLYDQKNTAAQTASEWTNQVLTEENKRMLRGLPLMINERGLTILHGCPGRKVDMLNEYLLPGHAQKGLTEKIQGRILIVGHTHIPMRTTYVVNPGSVGQPRDRNWRASYATIKDVWYRFPYIAEQDMSFRFVTQIVDIHRVPYDVRATIQKIKGTEDLPDTLGDRLTVGL